MISNTWTKIRREHGLYRYNPSGQFFARVRFRGKLYRKKLDTDDLALAKRKLRDFKNDLERTDATKGNMSFAAVLSNYEATLTGAKTTLENKRAIVTKLKQTLFGCGTLPLRSLKPSQLSGWLSAHYGAKSASSFNQALTVVRDACSSAVNDKIITESPAAGLKYRKPATPIRSVPTVEQAKAIIDDIRGQRWAANAGRSADFVQFLCLSGIGTAEASALTRADVDLDAGRIVVLRKKTSAGFAIPVFPQLRSLMEKLCAGKKPHERLFKVHGARKAISHSCRRLGFVRELPDGRLIATFTARSFRRLFITRCLERGIDVQTVSRWQGHKDGGKLILSTYAHINRPHADRMATLLTDGEPENVVPIITAAKA
jgi:Site-specific recombinase XerD